MNDCFIANILGIEGVRFLPILKIQLGLHRILIWPDIRPIMLPDTGYPVKN